MLNNKTILHILESPVVGGCERLCLTLAKNLVDFSHLFLFLSGFDGGFRNKFVDFPGCSKVIVNDRGRRGEKVLLSHVLHNFSPLGVIIWVGGRLPTRLHYLSDYQGNIVVHVGNPLVSRITDYRFLVSDYFLSKPSSVTLLCCSYHVRRSLLKSGYYSRFNSVVVYNSVPVPNNLYQVKEVLSFKITYIGRLDKIKDVSTIIESVYIFNLHSKKKLTLELIGSGSEVGSLRSMVTELNILDYVSFRGEIPSPFESLGCSDYLIFPATENEGFGLVLAEALAYGVPVITNAVGPVLEFKDENGFPFIIVEGWSSKTLF
ncbi:glycosyltransferase, partial [Coleofasciculus sp. LEGE 07081]|nr:glycosyltransferase [Coleofasciculus sp. LEGE 07081]